MFNYIDFQTNFLIFGGNMQRLFRLSFLAVLLCIFASSASYAQLPQTYVSGSIKPGEVRVFQSDSVYIINRDLVVGGTLIIEPGTTVYFYNNGRLIDSVGGRIIADGYAQTTYNPNPNGINPVSEWPAQTGGYGYADMRYFLYSSGGARTLTANSRRDVTVNPSKYNHIFNVLLDVNSRKIVDLVDPDNPLWPTAPFSVSPFNPNQVIVPYEFAIAFQAARMYLDPDSDPNLKTFPWKRFNGKQVDLVKRRIRFIGQPENNFSREWGHIIVLPGARAAFFRNVSFEGFKKDTTVDRTNLYADISLPGLTPIEYQALMNKMRNLTNGAGGAITTMSSRTWLLNCTFTKNMARNRGGAVQILQAPSGYPKHVPALTTFYPDGKNPQITNRDGSISDINMANKIPFVCNIDAASAEPLTDFQRQAFDDARIAVYLGRVRNLKFDRNELILANVGIKTLNTIPPISYVTELTDEVANYPQYYGNKAFGGALYIAGEEGTGREMEIALGINNKMMIGGVEVDLDPGYYDTFEALHNKANNYQNHMSSFGARGGAVYVGAFSSVIFGGSFYNNSTNTNFLINPNSAANSGYFSRGGAIFAENTNGRIQVRGGQRDALQIRNETDAPATFSNRTHFVDNTAGAGGAIFVDGNVSPMMSPVIGGYDDDPTWKSRDYGFDIRFDKNIASSFGGAIFSHRNLVITGAGGTRNDVQLYGGFYPVLFTNNQAGYYGGALAVNIPNSFPITTPFMRTVQVVRANFEHNHVGANVIDLNKPEVRGGGAIYLMDGDLNLVKGSLFLSNQVHNGNGGAIAMINPRTSLHRFFVSDLDKVHYDAQGIAISYTSVNEPFTYSNAPISPDVRMLTRFIENEIHLEEDLMETQMGSGTTQIGHGTPIPTDHMNATYWINNQTGYAVGGNGKIIRFTNGGTGWQYLPSLTDVTLNDMYFTSNQVGYAVGAYRTIMKTNNGGNTWFPLSVPPIALDPHINAVEFIGTETGWAVLNNGYVLRTDNAGTTWILSRPTNRDLRGIAWTSVNTGYIVGDRGLILKTINGSSVTPHWEVLIMPGLTSDLNKIIFKSATVGYAIGKSGVIIRTTDAGNTWDFVNSPTDQDLRDVFFFGQNLGFAVGANGTIIRTDDGGTTWSVLTSGTQNQLNSVHFVNATTGFISGNVGLILKTVDGGDTWTRVRPGNEAVVDVKRWHQETSLPENGIGLGGAIYILDEANLNRVGRVDTILFNRVRIQNNTAFTGSAIYSDNFDLKLIFNRSLVTGNMIDDRNTIGMEQNYISGPVFRTGGTITHNFASSDLASATIYGEVQGPLPSHIFSEAANSFYGNTARFLIRLPDAPNTKGVLAGTTGLGFGGTDTLRGNYWGHTEANLILELDNAHGSIDLARMETFFVDIARTEDYFPHYPNDNYLPFLFQPTNDPRTQGPFESIGIYTYRPIPLRNGADESEVGENSIPEKYLFSGHIYDIYDKGTDIKTADYSKRRMSPIEDFAVGIPPIIKRFNATGQPSYGKYVKRYMRDPFAVEMRDENGDIKYPFLSQIQGEWRPDATGRYYHPLGYPLYLETMADYNVGLIEKTNHDERMLNESVFFVINETTGDFIRVNFKQVDELAPYTEIFRARVELVPDSTMRNSNATIRRSQEGLLNLGSNGLFPFAPYSNPVLLDKLYRDAYAEDKATLQGRKYDASHVLLGNVPNLFSNRPTMPVNNELNGRSNTTYFAGERYRALPVDTGDVVRVISRTVLWREGVLAAYNDGIVFKVVSSTQPPVFTGDLPRLATDTIVKIVPSEYPWKDKDTLVITEFINRIWVTEDRAYPVANGWYSNANDPNIGMNARGRDSIFTVTAIDSNRWYDPRSILYPDQYTNLMYHWYVSDDTGLKRWLMVDTVRATGSKDGADGYFRFKGQPINPYVVPGGETVVVHAANFPPHYRSVDLLKALGEPQDVIDQFINIFPRYMSSPKYDVENARYLQQDTIDYGSNYITRQTVQIFVVDSVPRFLEPGDILGSVQVKTNLNGNRTETRDYIPSVYTCGKTNDGKLIANLTDALRFRVDFNTDDELEDSWAIDWDFRYGRTAYGFKNVAVRGGDAPDTVVVDPWDFKSDPYFKDYKIIKQIRPIWMSNQYLVQYDDPSTADLFGYELLSEGKLRYNIDRATALGLLTPDPRFNGALRTDTVFAIVANDGHGGVTEKYVGLFINVAPEITTDALPDAREGIDYNPQLLDSAKMIKVFDPNFGQKHRFELAYSDYPLNEILRDPCYPEAGTLPGFMKQTPKWLKINEESGLLYGTPGLMDAPKDEKVTVVVWDENGLPAVKTFDLRVLPTNHRPDLSGVPAIECVDENQPWETFITVRDLDLIRTNSNEQLTLRMIQPVDQSLLTITPSTINGPLNSDTVVVRLHTANFRLPRDPVDGKITVKILVTDRNGLTDTLEFRLQMSLATDFVCPITITNAIGATKVLQFGTAPIGATTGDSQDGEPVGTIDYDLCEFEIPPLPPNDVFDARWTIPTRNGLYRNIFPRAIQGVQRSYVYNGKFQAGGESAGGNTSPLYPVTLSWRPNDIPAVNNTTANPAGSRWYIRDASSNGQLFTFDMREPEKGAHTGNIQARRNPNNSDIFEIIFLTDAIKDFIILHDWSSSVDGYYATESKINSVSPNPIRSSATINFGLANDTQVAIEIYDNLGNKVATVTDSYFNAGVYSLEWNSRDMKGSILPSGTYTVRMVAGESVSSFPVVIVK